MTIATRLLQIRGEESRRNFSARLGVHANTVGNYENDRDPPVSYIAAVAEHYGMRLEWLVTGKGPMREGEEEPSLFQEQLAYSVSAAIDCCYGESLDSTSRKDRARVLRAVSKYLIGIGVTEQNIPDRDSLIGMMKLTGKLLGVPSPKPRRRRHAK